ncbi:MAG TPA: glycoside hydrolase family 76 protein [Chitinophagaceae bacterium]|nr:glycoside hydrolase family 76 protein [Chitinophagaceae bacterium]
MLLFSQVLFAQTKPQPRVYKKELQQLQAAIKKHFYDAASGYYKETAVPEKEGKPYAYLWGVCTVYQAANEMEKLGPGAPLLAPMLPLLDAYYDAAPPAPGYASYIMKLKGGDRFYDDNQWLGITSMDAYARTKNSRFLVLGKTIYRYMMTGFDTVLTGGIYWQESKKISKNTCSNGPGIILALQLYQATKNKTYLDTAVLLYNWVNEKLRAPSGLYWDNISIDGTKIGKATFSYNTGTMLQSNVYLYECTGDQKYLQQATAIADSSLHFFYGNERFRDDYWFNAVLLRGYQHLLQYNTDTKYIMGFRKCLDRALQQDKKANGLFGNDKPFNLVAHGGLLEILARFALLETHYDFAAIK